MLEELGSAWSSVSLQVGWKLKVYMHKTQTGTQSNEGVQLQNEGQENATTNHTANNAVSQSGVASSLEGATSY